MAFINIPKNLAKTKNIVPQDGAVWQPQDDNATTQTLNLMHKRDKTHCLVKINKAEFFENL